MTEWGSLCLWASGAKVPNLQIQSLTGTGVPAQFQVMCSAREPKPTVAAHVQRRIGMPGCQTPSKIRAYGETRTAEEDRPRLPQVL
jgi:hypothetical protein